MRKVGNIYDGGSGLKKVGNIRTGVQQKVAPQKKSAISSAWNFATRNLMKPVASASNLMEDVGKTAGFGIANLIKPELKFKDANKQLGIDFLGHQKDVWTGKNQRTYSDIMNEIAKNEKSKLMRTGMRTAGYAGDFILDPLNKLKIASLTNKGREASKVSKLALSAAEQAQQGQRALAQFGRLQTPQFLNRAVLGGSTKLNDAIRGTRAGETLFNVGSKFSSKIRPAGIGRNEFKILSDAKTVARNTATLAKSNAINFGRQLNKTLASKGASEADRANLLHAIEKGDRNLVPKGLEEVFEIGSEFKAKNTEEWAKLGGSVLEGQGLSHVATKEVAEANRKKALAGGKLYSSVTPQDIHRQYVFTGKNKFKYGADKKLAQKEIDDLIKAEVDDMVAQSTEGGVETLKYSDDYAGAEFDKYKRITTNPQWYRDYYKQYGHAPSKKAIREIAEENLKSGNSMFSKPFQEANDVLGELGTMEKSGAKDLFNKEKTVVNLKKAGISYEPNLFEKGKGGYIDKTGNVVEVSQASAKEINEAMLKQGGKAIFQEDLPIVAAKMGISTGNKRAGVEFLEATKGLKSDVAKKLANETYEKMTNIESLNKAIKAFDKIQNIWKSQALLGPSYHIRNFAGNLWNNYLADIKTGFYGKAGVLQTKMARGTLTKAEQQIAKELAEQGVINTGQFGADIERQLNTGIKGSSFNPFSQNFGLYKANFAFGGGVEDNAKIAHYLSKRAEGFGVKEAAESVKKYLFDYGDLSFAEQQGLKRVMPFYTWTSKNIPLQIQQFVENPGKFAKVATAKKNIERGVEKPDESFLPQYIAENSPIRSKVDEKGNTQYFLLGNWLPAAAAMNFLSRPVDNLVAMLSPIMKLPVETLLNKSFFFQDTLGNYSDLKSYPGQKKSFLGVDMDPRTVNIIRSIRLLNEADKLNPGLIFGDKETPSIFYDKLEKGSSVRGGRYTPNTTQGERTKNLFLGKYAGYNPKDAKYFYDRDTNSRINEIDTAIARAKKNKQEELLKTLLKQRKDFKEQRISGKDKSLYEKIKNTGKKLNPFYQ